MTKHESKQQAHWENTLENLTKRPSMIISKKLNSPKLTTPSVGKLILLIVSLPFIGWVIGASINPDGYLSDNPLTAYMAIFYVFLIALSTMGSYWYISIPTIAILILVIVLLRPNRALVYQIISSVIFIVSLVASIIIMTLVKDADSSEFTG